MTAKSARMGVESETLCASFRFLLFRIGYGRMYAVWSALRGKLRRRCHASEVLRELILNLPNPIGLRSSARQGYVTIGRRSYAETQTKDLWKRPILG